MSPKLIKMVAKSCLLNIKIYENVAKAQCHHLQNESCNLIIISQKCDTDCMQVITVMQHMRNAG